MPPVGAQVDQASEDKLWWQDLGDSVLVPLGDWHVYRQNGLRIDNEAVSTLTSQSKTVVFVLRSGRPVGAIALADIVRPESRGEDLTRCDSEC